MSYPSTAASCKSKTTVRSTLDWRAWWRDQAVEDGIVSERRLCAEADAQKARGENPRYIDPSRWRGPSDHIPDNWQSMSIEALMAHFDRVRRRDGAPQATVEALMLGLRERGVKALAEWDVKRRLSELSEPQLHEICGRLQRLRPEIARAWAPNEITILVDAWNKCHG